MVQPLPISSLATGCPLLLQVNFLERFLSDPLGQIVAALLALLVATWATIRNNLIKSYLQAAGEHLRIYAERNEGSDEIHHRIGVSVSNLLWVGLFGRLGEDPVERIIEELDAEGFTWLSTAEVEEGTLDHQNCWRRQFSFREVHEGFAIDRERAQPRGRENVTETLFNELDGGGVHAVVGHPGSGKSTICRAVATRWYDSDELGPVFYRPSGEREEISEPASFRERIEVGKRISPVLVVVEDAVRRDAVPIFETIRGYLTDEDVSFLLDAREHEWDTKSFEDVLRTLVERPDTSRWRELRGLRSDVDRHDVPPLDVREVERAIERFEKVTEREVREDAQQILRRIRLEEEDVSASGRRSGMWPSPMLLLTYHFPIGKRKSSDGESSSSLEDNVVETLRRIEDTDIESLGIETADLLQEIALLVNILNASHIGVYEELLYALADTDEEYDAIESCTAKLDGKVLFGRSSGTRYWSNHPLWSELYLERFLDRNWDRKRKWTKERFEDCVNAVFRVVDEEERRERIQQELGQATDEFRQIKETPTERADEYIEKIFKLGTARPKLAPLFATSEYSEIRVPRTCSGWTRAYCSIWRLEMYKIGGEYPKAEKEVEAFRDIGQEVGLDERKIQSEYLHNLGRIAQDKDDDESARTYYEDSLEIFEDLGNSYGEATTLNNLGMVAYRQGNYKGALTYYEDSLEIFGDLGNRGDEGVILNNLGMVAYRQDNYKGAREYFEDSLEIFGDLGNRREEAATLNNLGRVAQDEGDNESALTYYEKSLDISRDIGNRYGKAAALNNLGRVAQDEGDNESALTYYEDSLEICRKISAIRLALDSLDNLVVTCRFIEDEESAIKWCLTALSTIDESDLDLPDERQRFESYLAELQSSEE